MQNIQDLPQDIPIFPLPRAIVMPGIALPLNIFEPRYIAMVNHALKTHRLIGMIQPKADGSLYKTGCAGRIVAFEETTDGRYLITLKGVCRFDIAHERDLDADGFRSVHADWSPYAHDLKGEEGSQSVCRDAMLATLKNYLIKNDMLCEEWDAMQTIDCNKLVSTLAVVCPFGVEDKQAILQAPDLQARMKALKTCLEKDLLHSNTDQTGGCTSCH